MNREVWEHIVREAKNGNEALFNKAVTSNLHNHFYDIIIKKVQDESLTLELYNLTMFKFWERFILKGQKLPETNIDAYIYQMSRNAFYDIKRQKNNRRNLMTVSMASQEIVEKFRNKHDNTNHLVKSKFDSKELLSRKLFQIVQSLDQVCQKIIGEHIIDGQSLVKLNEEINECGSYNALVLKKKRCMKTLSKLLYAAIKEKKYIFPQTQ